MAESAASTDFLTISSLRLNSNILPNGILFTRTLDNIQPFQSCISEIIAYSLPLCCEAKVEVHRLPPSAGEESQGEGPTREGGFCSPERGFIPCGNGKGENDGRRGERDYATFGTGTRALGARGHAEAGGAECP